jgi:mRNA interferase YafQ
MTLATIRVTPEFKRQLRRLARKHYPVAVLKDCAEALISHDPIGLRRIKDHALTGRWTGYREFHPARLTSQSSQYDNWVVIYLYKGSTLTFVFVATGDHQLLADH